MSINVSINMSINVNKAAADLVTFTEEIINGKLHLLCSVRILPVITEAYGGE